MPDLRPDQLRTQMEQQNREHQSYIRGLRTAVDAEITRLNTRIGQLTEQVDTAEAQRDEFRAALTRAETELDAIRDAGGDATALVIDLLRRYRSREDIDEHELAALIVRQAVDPVAVKLRQAQPPARAPRTGRRRRLRPW